MKAPEVALHGFVYSANFGDMLLSSLTLNIIRRRLPHADLCKFPLLLENPEVIGGIRSDTGVGRFRSVTHCSIMAEDIWRFRPDFNCSTGHATINGSMLPGWRPRPWENPMAFSP